MKKVLTGIISFVMILSLTGCHEVPKLEDGKEVLLPAIRECIKNVDLQKGEITVHVMKGLLDE